MVVVVVLAGQDKDREWLLTEKDKFDHEHDKDANGVLDREEILAWVVPTNEYDITYFASLLSASHFPVYTITFLIYTNLPCIPHSFSLFV